MKKPPRRKPKTTKGKQIRRVVKRVAKTAKRRGGPSEAWFKQQKSKLDEIEKKNKAQKKRVEKFRKKMGLPKHPRNTNQNSKKRWEKVKTFKPVTENTYDEVGEYIEFTLEQIPGIVCMAFVDNYDGTRFGSFVDTPKKVLDWWIELPEAYHFSINPNSLVQVAHRKTIDATAKPETEARKRGNRVVGKPRKPKPTRKRLPAKRVTPRKPKTQPRRKQKRNGDNSQKPRSPRGGSRGNAQRLRKK